jgi:hypothetical protein
VRYISALVSLVSLPDTRCQHALDLTFSPSREADGGARKPPASSTTCGHQNAPQQEQHDDSDLFAALTTINCCDINCCDRYRFNWLVGTQCAHHLPDQEHRLVPRVHLLFLLATARHPSVDCCEPPEMMPVPSRLSSKSASTGGSAARPSIPWLRLQTPSALSSR